MDSNSPKNSAWRRVAFIFHVGTAEKRSRSASDAFVGKRIAQHLVAKRVEEESFVRLDVDTASRFLVEKAIRSDNVNIEQLKAPK